MLTARLWWRWVAVELSREAMWWLDAASAADGALLAEYDSIMRGP